MALFAVAQFLICAAITTLCVLPPPFGSLSVLGAILGLAFMRAIPALLMPADGLAVPLIFRPVRGVRISDC